MDVHIDTSRITNGIYNAIFPFAYVLFAEIFIFSWHTMQSMLAWDPKDFLSGEFRYLRCICERLASSTADHLSLSESTTRMSNFHAPLLSTDEYVCSKINTLWNRSTGFYNSLCSHGEA